MAADSNYTVPLWIGGKEVVTATTFPVISPATHNQIWLSSSASISDVDDAIAAAKAAFPAWTKTKPVARRNILLKAAEVLERRAEELGEYMMQETGANRGFAAGSNVPLATELVRDVAGRLSGIMGSIPVCREEGTAALVVKEAFGVVLGIAPWNAPYILGIRAMLYAIAAGNTCILKGSELSPRCFWAIGSAFTEAGLPPGVLNVLYHRPQDAPQITTALIESPVIKKVNFTGSTAVGRIIASTAGKNLKPVLMELGGKASAIVLDDADVQKAATQCALGAFLNSGQICMSTERILLHTALKEKFIPAFSSAVEAIFGGENPAPILVQSLAVKKNKRLVSDAIASGAEIVHGDPSAQELHPETQEPSHTRMKPIIVSGVKKGMELYYTESFGPTVSIIEIESEEEAVEIANDTEYGLTGAVFTENLARGLRVAKRIESGAVHINAMTVHDEAGLPHGGAKLSGWGRFNGMWGLDEFLRIKTITYQE